MIIHKIWIKIHICVQSIQHCSIKHHSIFSVFRSVPFRFQFRVLATPIMCWTQLFCSNVNKFVLGVKDNLTTINKLILNVFWGNYLDMGVVFGANTFRKPNYLKKRSWFCQMASGNLLNLRTFLSEEKLLIEQGMALDTQDLETPMSSPFFLSLKILTLIKPFQEMLRRGSSLNLKIVHFLSNKVYAIGNGIKPEPPNSKSEYFFK